MNVKSLRWEGGAKQVQDLKKSLTSVCLLFGGGTGCWGGGGGGGRGVHSYFE